MGLTLPMRSASRIVSGSDRPAVSGNSSASSPLDSDTAPNITSGSEGATDAYKKSRKG